MSMGQPMFADPDYAVFRATVSRCRDVATFLATPCIATSNIDDPSRYQRVMPGRRPGGVHRTPGNPCTRLLHHERYERLRQLCYREEITWVLNEYCNALDRMDLPRLSALFTSDCVVEYGPEEWLRSRGAANLEQSLARMWRWARTSHQLSNVQIEFSGDDEAIVQSYVQAWHERPDGVMGTIFGQYHDRFLRVDAGWRIAGRRDAHERQ